MKKQSVVSKLVHKITFLENITKSTIKEAVWKEVQTSFAEIKTMCDNRFVSLEGVAFGNVVTEEYFLFKTRFIKDIHSEMRISFKKRVFEIKRIIDESERGRMLSIIGLEI